jgi:hypothetical protein
MQRRLPHPPPTSRETRGLGGGAADFGADWSRGFRALKVWMALKSYGTGASERSFSIAASSPGAWPHVSTRKASSSSRSPVRLNVVCFRFKKGTGLDLDVLNREIVADLQEQGIARCTP